MQEIGERHRGGSLDIEATGRMGRRWETQRVTRRWVLHSLESIDIEAQRMQEVKEV